RASSCSSIPRASATTTPRPCSRRCGSISGPASSPSSADACPTASADALALTLPQPSRRHHRHSAAIRKGMASNSRASSPDEQEAGTPPRTAARSLRRRFPIAPIVMRSGGNDFAHVPLLRNMRGERAAHVQVFLDMLTKLRAPSRKGVVSFLVRALAILSMSYAAAFGFLVAITSPEAHYDPNSFAIGSSRLFA